tara:strand:- start:273 stop:1073 length:801 start_codon:yes stop_codon:yes gene_type:complete
MGIKNQIPQDFKQLYSSMIFFKEDMKKRWNLDEYNDPTQPAVFMGLYESRDINTFISHKGPKLLYFGGSDFTSNNLDLVSKSPNTVCIGYGADWMYKVLDSYKIPYTETRILLKNFDNFTPTPLGENIYVYKGINGNRPDHYKWEEIVNPLQEVFGKDRIIYTQNLPLHELKEKYYQNCFIYIRPNPLGGGTAMFELGHMGRKTITNEHSNFSTCLGYQSLNEMLDLIMEESKKIGTVQPQVAETLKSMFDREGNWLNFSNYKEWS